MLIDPFRPRLSPVHIRKKGDLGEGVKTDADGEQDVRDRDISSACGIPVLKEKARVLEVPEKPDVEHKGEDKEPVLHKEPLKYEFIKVATRNYKD